VKKYPISRKADLVVQEMDNEVLIYDLTENKAYCLNQTSALVWQLCDGNKTIDEISEILGQKLNSSANQDIVWFALDQLKKENLIENEIGSHKTLTGMSRREVIRKVGLGTMMALPIVASISAPLAIHAASSCNTGAICNCSTDVGMNTACTEAGAPVCITFSSGGMNCMCVQTNNGNTMGTCLLV
jgi:Coenzyme PQQ synthesis protein D (PqqD)